MQQNQIGLGADCNLPLRFVDYPVLSEEHSWI